MATEAKKRARKRWKLNHREAYLAEKKRYREKHKDDIREYRRNNTIKSSFLGGNHLDREGELKVEGKRPYPEDCLCETCGIKRVRGLNYHHWDDSDFSLGLWVCFRCHMVIHTITRNNTKEPVRIYYI